MTTKPTTKKDFMFYLCNSMIMVLAIVLTDFMWIRELGNWRYIGLIGYAMIGWYWNKEKLI